MSIARRRHVTPLVFSVDGLRGVEEADVAGLCKKVTTAFLTSKWKRAAYLEVCGFVRSQISIALTSKDGDSLPSGRARSNCAYGDGNFLGGIGNEQASICIVRPPLYTDNTRLLGAPLYSIVGLPRAACPHASMSCGISPKTRSQHSQDTAVTHFQI